jgi:hypothetical protein
MTSGLNKFDKPQKNGAKRFTAETQWPQRKPKLRDVFLQEKTGRSWIVERRIDGTSG